VRFRVARVDDNHSDQFWVVADTQEEARRLVALNVMHARDAIDPAQYDRAPSEDYHVPVGVILSRSGQAFPVRQY
jgi:hypothetical protein